MPCIRIKDGFMCLGGPNYAYDGIYFEMHSYFGPLRTTKSGEPSDRPCGKKFWAAWEKWDRLSAEEKEAYRI